MTMTIGGPCAGHHHYADTKSLMLHALPSARGLHFRSWMGKKVESGADFSRSVLPQKPQVGRYFTPVRLKFCTAKPVPPVLISAPKSMAVSHQSGLTLPCAIASRKNPFSQVRRKVRVCFCAM
jgi:hypothetical protein